MRLKLTILFTLLYFAVTCAVAQQKRVDSLLLLLHNAKHDTSRLTLLLQLSSAYMSVNPALTYSYAHSLQKLAHQTNKPKKGVDAKIMMGISWGIRSRYDSALYYFNQSLNQAQSIKYNSGVGRAYINTGQVFERLDDDIKASAYYLKALSLFERDKYDYGIGLCLNNLGSIYSRQGSYVTALKYYEYALKNYKAQGNISKQAFVLSNTAACYSSMKKYDKALACYKQSLAIRTKIADLTGMAYVYAGMGEIYTHLKAYDKAIHFLFRSKNYMEKIGEQDYLTGLYRQIADNYLEQRKFTWADEYARKSLIVAQKIRSASKMANAYATLSLINKRKNHFKDAYDYQTLYIQYRDSVANDKKLKAVTLLSLERSMEENAMLNADNTLKAAQLAKNDIKIKSYRTIIAMSASIIALIILLSISLYRSNRHKKATNQLLESQKMEILEFNEELSAINEELVTQMEITVSQNRELEKLNTIKSRLYSVISHDFRSPLSTLKSMLLMAQSGDVSNDELPVYLHQISLMVDQTFIFLENLLVWSKSQLDGIKFKPVLFDIHQVVADNIALFKLQAEMKDIDLVLLHTEPLMVNADREMIKLVIRNLLANAIKFTGKGGKVILNGERNANGILFSVTDTGTGISDTAMAALFESGYTTLGTAQEKGSGLGLIMCKEFIGYHKGQIWAESNPGKGSVFYFTLPVS